MENHRRIVENKIGRKLLKQEIIHHKDGDSSNNIIDNLEIVSASEHRTRKHLTKDEWELKNKDRVSIEFIQGILYRDFNECINMFFTPRMKNIIYKKLHREKLSKTEQEYYSRIIKKRLYAITNETLQRIAHSLLF